LNHSTKIAKESVISFTGMGLGQVFRYLFTTLLARWIGVEMIGIYSISNAVTRIFEVIGKLGLDQGTLRGVSREEENSVKQSVILSALKIGAISGLLFMFVQIALSGWISEKIFHGSH
jgi:O-antigen/teichoic acid export membrane protein